MALSLAAVCTEELFRSKLAAISKTGVIKGGIYLYKQDYPKDCTWEQSLWCCSNLCSQSLFQRSIPNNLFVMTPLLFFFSHWTDFTSYRNTRIWNCFTVLSSHVKWHHSHREIADCTQGPFLLILIRSQIKGLKEYQWNTNMVKQVFSNTVFISWFWHSCSYSLPGSLWRYLFHKYEW